MDRHILSMMTHQVDTGMTSVEKCDRYMLTDQVDKDQIRLYYRCFCSHGHFA